MGRKYWTLDNALLFKVYAKCKKSEYFSFNGTPCMEWQNLKDKDGYGRIEVAGINWRVTRFLLLYKTGRLDEIAMHKCDNPPCCNIDHLRWGSYTQNLMDSFFKGRRRHKLRKTYDYLEQELILSDGR